MFWCMLACGITAFYCDILQNCTGGQVFHSENVMRIRALTCGLLQHSKIWTQNPSKATSWGLNSPSRHQYNVSKCNNLHGSSCAVPLCSFLPLGGLVHVGCDDSCDILQSSDSVVVIAIRSPKH